MRRIILIVVIICVALSGCGKLENSFVFAPSETTDGISPASQPTEQVSIQPSLSPSEQQSEDAETEEVALLYADPKIDMFLMIRSPDWTYTKQLYEGEVYFYLKDENPLNSANGFAVSSQQKGDYTIEETWEYVQSSLETNIPGFDWTQEDNIDVGSYTGYRYHFSGTGIIGDYIIWETDSLQYICSFTADPKKYDEYYNMLVESLLSFLVLSEIEN